MGFHDICRAYLPLLLLVVLCAVPAHLSQELDPPMAKENEEVIAAIRKELNRSTEKVLQEYSTIPFPGLPPINIPGDTVSISLSLADIYLEGLEDNDHDWSLSIGRASGYVTFSKLGILVGHYSSSGHIVNLPFNGEGPMYIYLHGFHIGISLKFKIKLPYTICALKNTTAYEFDLHRVETHFENLNTAEGADLGQVVDIILPSFGQDVIDFLSFLLKDKSSYYYQSLDSMIINFINSKTHCTTKFEEDTLDTEDLIKAIDMIIHDMVNYRDFFSH